MAFIYPSQNGSGVGSQWVYCSLTVGETDIRPPNLWNPIGHDSGNYFNGNVPLGDFNVYSEYITCDLEISEQYFETELQRTVSDDEPEFEIFKYQFFTLGETNCVTKDQVYWQH